MSKKLGFWGALVTVFYFIIIGVKVAYDFDKFLCLGLNELGDFLAGAFGPVAFLWLVLGFLQQGKELKISSQALKLQVSELRSSVQQQTKLASIAEQSLLDQISKSERLSEPMIEVESSKSENPSESSGVLIIKNHSASCESVRCSFEFSEGNYPQIAYFNYLPTGSVKEVSVSGQPIPMKGAWFVIRYKKNTGVAGVHRFWLKWNMNSRVFDIAKADLEALRAVGMDPDQTALA